MIKINNISWLGLRNWHILDKWITSRILPRGASITFMLSKFKNWTSHLTQREAQPSPSRAVAAAMPSSTGNINFQKRILDLSVLVWLLAWDPKVLPHITQNVREYQTRKSKELWLTELIIQILVTFHLSMEKQPYLYSILSVQLGSPPLCRQQTHSLNAGNSIFSSPHSSNPSLSAYSSTCRGSLLLV